MANMYKREPQELTGPGGDQPELRVRYVDNLDGTWSLAVVGISSALPDGAATSAKQDTTNIKLDEVVAAIESISGGPTGAYALVQKNTDGDSTYKYYGFVDVAGDWYVKRIHKTTNYAEFKLGLLVDSPFGVNFLTNVQALSGWQDYWGAF